MAKRGTHRAPRQTASRQARIDPAAIVVAAILIFGLVGIGAGVKWRDSQTVQSAASATSGAELPVQISDAANDMHLSDSSAPRIDAQEENSQPPSATSEEQGATESNAEEAFDAQSYFATQQFSSDGVALYNPLIIGDSVTVACMDQLNAAFPYGLVDAEVSRNVWESPYATYRDLGTVGQVVIFCLGTNNAVVDWQIDDELLNMVEDDKTVFFVNTRSNQSWVESTNQTLARIPERHPNVAAIIDWYSYSEGHDEWFSGDGTHPNEEGAQAYVAFIYDSVVAYLNDYPI